MKKQFTVIAFLASFFLTWEIHCNVPTTNGIIHASLWYCLEITFGGWCFDVIIFVMLLLSIRFGIRTIRLFRAQDASLSSGQRRIGIISGFVILALNAVIFVFIVLLLPPVTSEAAMRRSYRPDFSCINNLRMIDAAAEEWAGAKGKTNGEEVVVSEANQYLKGGKPPVCPDGGTYAYGVVGSYPTCSMADEKLTKKHVTLLSWEWSPYGIHRFGVDREVRDKEWSAKIQQLHWWELSW